MPQTTTEEIKTSLRNVVWKFATGRVNMGEADQQIVGYLNQLIQQVKKEKDSECERRVIGILKTNRLKRVRKGLGRDYMLGWNDALSVVHRSLAQPNEEVRK